MISKLLLIFGLAILLCGEAYFAYRLHILSAQQEEIKKDYAAANNITLGLFSVEEWHDEIAGILNHQVRHFSLTTKQKAQLQKEVEQIILALINKAEALVEKPQKSIGGKIKRFAVKTFVKTDKIKAEVPAFARMVIAKVDNPANKNQISKMAMGKVAALERTPYLDSTIKANHAITGSLYKKYQVTDRDELNKRLNRSLDQIRTTMYTFSSVMLGIVLAVLLLWWLLRKNTALHATLFIMSLLFAFILLGVGLTASMIEVDARIKSLDFMLLGEHVVFKDQVLFFQSKSILDVVHVLISQPKVDSILVGVLIMVFSILFPIMKLSSTGIHLLGRRKLAENKFIKYFAFQSGKWSMADVIVIAILMAYIGLNGLLESQLAALKINSDPLTIVSTNNTALQPGYIIFICFVLYSLILSTILKFITPHDAHQPVSADADSTVDPSVIAADPTTLSESTFRGSNIIVIIALSIVLCIEGFCGYHLSLFSRQQEQLKQDYSTINNITFGIFSIDQWREKIMDVVNGRVDNFKVSSQQKKAMQVQVEKQLHGLVAKTAKEINRPQKTFAGKLKKFAFNQVIDVREIQAQVPSFARTIITKVNSPASTKRLKNIATSKLGQLERQTYDSTGEAHIIMVKAMYKKYQVKNITELNSKLSRQLVDIRTASYHYAYIMFGCVVLVTILWWLLRRKAHLQNTLFVLSLLIAFVLLGVGVTSSIIEVDARMGNMSFMLLGEKLGFENQVLFYQNKSLLEVIQVLVAQPKPDAILVGVLLFVFVIVLPILILIAAGLHVLGNEHLAENKIVKYLAFESGKWNMADVMVVGIGMTYIGLNGILKSQLGGLNIHNDMLTTVTTNNSSLQPGFLVFAAYVLYEIVLVRMLKQITARSSIQH
ncbi:paraquat-inducible protein A [Mucilaginibacter galii]|uniref:paraquat-inducible protein A n=1 Tax=Mucilaginibacter galii TaxID=2005073 RepID=UPI001E29F463|nr:paraquat-inducible protein A [Mucilaginibacter galii]